MTLADARARCPDLVTIEGAPDADHRTLEHIAVWCERFTPSVTIDPPHGLFLDITGIAHLFDGEAALVAEVEKRLAAQGFAARAAIAPTPGAAWACVRFAGQRIIASDELRTVLAALPVSALRLQPDSAALLRRLGLKRIGDLVDAPRQPFAARAGEQALRRLDEAFGRAREALQPHRPPPPAFALRRLVEPLTTLEGVLIAVEAACEDLAADLDQRGAGVRKLRLGLYGPGAHARAIEIGFSRASADARRMLRLLREKLSLAPETIDAAFGIETVRLDAVEIAPIRFTPTDLAPASKRDPDAETRLVDTLCVRLGNERVLRPALTQAHLPDDAERWAPAGQGVTATASPAPPDGVPRRPLQIFEHAQPIETIATVPDGPPLRFRWRRVLREIVRAEGPERLLPDWLKHPGARARDYYRAEDTEGRRYWLYREGFYGEEAEPRWYIQGVFA